MASLLKYYGLDRNPFVDRTAEKTDLEDEAMYLHSDLQGFKPSDTTYLFFGKRGSGKTTIRVQMIKAYDKYNAEADSMGEENPPYFIIDLCKPGFLTGCLRCYMQNTGTEEDSWDASFSDTWTSNDMTDCVLSYAATKLMKIMDKDSAERTHIIERLRSNPKMMKQFLILLTLYAHGDNQTLMEIDRDLLKLRIPVIAKNVAWLAGSVAAIGAASYGIAKTLTVSPVAKLYPQKVPIENVSRTAALSTAAALSSWLFVRQKRLIYKTMRRAYEANSSIRVVKQRPIKYTAALLYGLFSNEDSISTIKRLYIGQCAEMNCLSLSAVCNTSPPKQLCLGSCAGETANQKLDLLESLISHIGYKGIAVFGDCFDEVTLLDPVMYPNAIKVFAREVCRNEILNFGRLHFFFPDSRMQLDLNTDKILKEARFDRHFVRDLTWSRFQLQQLAELRFKAAKRTGPSSDAKSFDDLFHGIRPEDLESAIAKLHTPRELMVCLTELLNLVESHRQEGGFTAGNQELETAVQKAREQAV